MCRSKDIQMSSLEDFVLGGYHNAGGGMTGEEIQEKLNRFAKTVRTRGGTTDPGPAQPQVGLFTKEQLAAASELELSGVPVASGAQPQVEPVPIGRNCPTCGYPWNATASPVQPASEPLPDTALTTTVEGLNIFQWRDKHDALLSETGRTAKLPADVEAMCEGLKYVQSIVIAEGNTHAYAVCDKAAAMLRTLAGIK
jgi:hypothetical protein